MSARSPVTLAVDVGATAIKLMLLDPRGRPISERMRVGTPTPATPTAMLRSIARALPQLPPFDRVSLGFPGVIVDGVVRTAANLSPAWIGVDVARQIRRITGKPTRAANDADVQGLGVIEGRGVELVLTLGTGVGSALFLDGGLVPNLELGHHPFERGRTYEERLGDRALKRIGTGAWNRRLRGAVETLERAFNCRRLYLGGGNARLVRSGLPANARVVDNVAGLLGGIRLWGSSGRNSSVRPARVSPAGRGGRSRRSPARRSRSKKK
ncbi:MAG TPA: ROK family protein [Candidatus Eisenbacteria bacterium]|jgi:polyphosphate glucokinase